MSFMDNLAANPGGGGIYGQPPQEDVLGIVNSLKDREMRDFKDKANFMADLSLKQDKMRALFDPSKLGGPQSSQDVQGNQPNVVMAKDPNQMTGYEKGELGIRQQQLGQEDQKIKQQGKFSQQGLDIKSQQEKLNQSKSDQINATKQADMQRKIDESNKKIELATQALQDKNATSDKQLQMHKDLAAAVEERHKLEMQNMQNRFDTTSQQHQQTIDALNEKIKQGAKTKTTTEVNAEGNKKTVTTEKGDGSDMVNVIGKDGKTYSIPKDKLDDKDSDGTPHWKQPGDDDASS